MTLRDPSQMLLRFQDWAKIFQDPHYWAGTSVYPPPPSFVMAHYMLSSHRKFSFSHRECMNLQKGSLWNKTSFFKDIFCVKRFWPIVRVANNSHEKFTVVHPHAQFLYLLDSQNFVTRKLFRKQRINIHVALWKFIKIWCLNQSEVHYNSNVSTFLHFDVLIAFGS